MLSVNGYSTWVLQAGALPWLLQWYRILFALETKCKIMRPNNQVQLLYRLYCSTCDEQLHHEGMAK